MSLPTAPTLEGTKTHSADEAKLFPLMVTSRVLSLSSVTVERVGGGGDSDRDWDIVPIMLLSAYFHYFTVSLILCPLCCISSYIAFSLLVHISFLCDMAQFLCQIFLLSSVFSASHVVLRPSYTSSPLSSSSIPVLPFSHSEYWYESGYDIEE